MNFTYKKYTFHTLTPVATPFRNQETNISLYQHFMNSQPKTIYTIDTMHSGDFNYDLLDQLIYRGEGNSSIVVALRNKSKVIRLLKKDGKLMRSSQDHHVTQHPMRSIQFIHLIMKPLTSPFMSEATQLAHLKSDFINMLSKKVEFERPSHRLDKILHLDDQYGLIMDDLCALPIRLTRHLNQDDLVGPMISVEIKPKQGFLPHLHRPAMRSSINDQMVAKLKGKCMYGLTQNLKLVRGRISERSNYCPISLFSGCPIKMKTALEDLIQHPQNNLRIFKDLTLAYDETNQLKLFSLLDSFFQHDSTVSNLSQNATVVKTLEDTSKRFVELLIQCLVYQPPVHADNRETNIDPRQHKDIENLSSNSNHNHDICLQHSTIPKCRRCDMHSSPMKPLIDPTHAMYIHKLPQSCVLAKVLQAQKLDSVGVFEARYMLEWLLEHSRYSNTSVDILEELSRPQMPTGFGAPGQLPFESKQDYYFRKVWEFLVSLTGKDCSIMITIQQIPAHRLNVVLNKAPEVRNHILRENETNNHYLFNVGIADFDQKMPLKILRICDNLNQIATLTQTYECSKIEKSNVQVKSSQKVFVG